NLVLAVADSLRDGDERFVLLRRRRQRQYACGLPRAPPDLGHDGSGIDLDGFERDGHGHIPIMPGWHGRASLPTGQAPCNDRSDNPTGMTTMKLKDQVAIVTGAGRNIGEEVSKLFAAEGAKIAVVDLDKARGQRTVDKVKGAGGDAALFVADVSKG